MFGMTKLGVTLRWNENCEKIAGYQTDLIS